ncbi:MAG: hypothetical protein QOI63_994 [Thermoplasmata archaeon]|jgi:hypothetical protein|nr:hypothetical protein [Thermoplasmata archaeon]
MRWSLRDEMALIGRYLLLGALLGVVGDGALTMTGNDAFVPAAQAGAGLLVLGCWLQLAHAKGDPGWEAGLLAASGALLGLSAFGGDPLLLVLLPLPWVGLRPLRFAGRAALGAVNLACSLTLARLFLKPGNPLPLAAVLIALLGVFLWHWHRQEATAARRRALRWAAHALSGAAAAVGLLALGLFADDPLLALAFTVTPALLLTRHSLRPTKMAAARNEAT